MEINVFGLKFSGLNINDVLSIEDDIKFVVTVNAEFIVEAHKCEKFRYIINNNISTFDGQIPYFFAKLITAKKFEKISGSDLIYAALSFCKKNNKKIFLLGASESINKKAVIRAKHEFGVDCYGFSPIFEGYPFSELNQSLILKEIESIKPNFLFVGFGAKKQEFWINDNLEKLKNCGVEFVVGCGGSIAFLSGEIKRAPVLFQKIGLEGFYRLFQEPKMFRLIRLLRSLYFFKYLLKTSRS